MNDNYNSNDQFNSFIYCSNSFLRNDYQKDEIESMVKEQFPDCKILQYEYAKDEGWAVMIAIFDKIHYLYELTLIDKCMEVDFNRYSDYVNIILNPGSSCGIQWIVDHVRDKTTAEYENFDWVKKHRKEFVTAFKKLKETVSTIRTMI